MDIWVLLGNGSFLDLILFLFYNNFSLFLKVFFTNTQISLIEDMLNIFNVFFVLLPLENKKKDTLYYL